LSIEDKKNVAAKTKVRTVNEDFAVKEDIETVLSKGIVAAMNLHNGRSNLNAP